MNRPYWIPLCAAVLTACGGRESTPITKIAGPATNIAVVRIDMQSVPQIYEATGTVRAKTAAVLSSKVLATVREVKVEPGDRVHQGQLLVLLDARELDAGAKASQAALDETHGALSETDDSIAAAKANLDLSQATFKRMKELFEKTSISNQEYDEAQAKVRMAEANYQALLARRQQLDSRIVQTQQALRSTEVQQSYTRIVAPFSGIVTEKTVQPGTMASPGTPLLTIEDPASYRLEVPVEESHWKDIRAGQSVTVRLDVLDKDFAAKVSEVVPALDPGSHSFIAKISLPASLPLRSGLFGKVSFHTGDTNALAVPLAAVREQGQLETVFVNDNGVARMRIITLGRNVGDRQIILSGLAPGDQVITAPPPNLHDGAPVEVRP